MRILAVLDLRGGEVVRGIAGRREAYRPIVSQLTESSRPVDVAKAFRTQLGLNELYLADLDAIAGAAPALSAYQELQALGCRLWVDAGVKTANEAMILSKAGVERIVLGLETLAGPETLAECVQRIGSERVVFSLDLSEGRPLGNVAAWSGAAAWDIAEQAIALGIRSLIVLDIARVGVDSGTGTEELCTRLAEAFPEVELIAGGGVRGPDDLRRLERCGVRAALVASALHDGRLTRAHLSENRPREFPMPQDLPLEASFQDDEASARRLDALDPLAVFRERFFLPSGPDGQPALYFCGNSLGLQPRTVPELMTQELADWARLAVEGHFKESSPWYSYHELFRDSGARLVGAQPGEVVMMNSLTVNLHLMLTTFYRPEGKRVKILIDGPTFPSDLYAVQSQAALHGLAPQEVVRIAAPRQGEQVLRQDDIEALLETEGQEIALVLFNGVNYYTGQYFDLAKIAAAARRQGCRVGLDLAHAVANVPLQLHDWDIDFAVWCNYKYLNAGPGAVAGCFIHERHGRNPELPRLAGWWGNDPATRFRMHLEPTFTPQPGAAGWQLSNPPIFALVPLRASLALFDEAGFSALRAKSHALGAYLDFLLDRLPAGRFERITPRAFEERGCQVSLLIQDRPRELHAALQRHGVICDFREPNVIRLAPVPLYNSFHDVWRLARVLREA